MNRFFLPLILIIFVIFTFATAVVKPKLYKPVKFEITDIAVQADINHKLPTSALPVKPKMPDKAAPVQIKSNQTGALPPHTTAQQVEVRNNSFPAPKIAEQKPAAAPIKNVDVQNRPLTEQEELIVWNAWRSRLQNKVMADSNIYAPYGTTFRFSFTVDRSGQISNLRVWAEPANYTQEAMKGIRPVIMSYQGRQILNFPPRTKRIMTNVQGGFKVADTERYSTPQDFSDVEKVK